jgi:hypothetical protein
MQMGEMSAVYGHNCLQRLRLLLLLLLLLQQQRRFNVCSVCMLVVCRCVIQIQLA